MNNKKTVFAFLVCTVLCAAVFAQNEGDFKTDGKGTITKYEGWDTKIVIPAQIGGMPVTGIGDKAFTNMGITSVTLPTGIKLIGSEAFAFNKLTTLTIPAGVEKIGYNAFLENQLKTIVLGTNVNFERDHFGTFLYYEYFCNGRKAGTYDTTVRYTEKKVGDYWFYETKYGAVLTLYTGNEGARLIIPGKLGNAVVKGIDGGFSSNKGISRVQLPDSLVFIGSRAFEANDLTSVTIPNSVTSIGESAFSSNRLTSVTFEGTITSVDFGYTFVGDLLDKYLAGGVGTYTRTANGSTWTKQ